MGGGGGADLFPALWEGGGRALYPRPDARWRSAGVVATPGLVVLHHSLCLADLRLRWFPLHVRRAGCCAVRRGASWRCGEGDPSVAQINDGTNTGKLLAFQAE